MFIKKELYQKYGLYDESKKIAMDYDFLLRISSEPFSYVDKPLVKFSAGGASNKNIKKGLLEVRDSFEKVYGCQNYQFQAWR